MLGWCWLFKAIDNQIRSAGTLCCHKKAALVTKILEHQRRNGGYLYQAALLPFATTDMVGTCAIRFAGGDGLV